MVGFRDLVGTGIAPVSKKTAVKSIFKGKIKFLTIPHFEKPKKIVKLEIILNKSV